MWISKRDSIKTIKFTCSKHKTHFQHLRKDWHEWEASLSLWSLLPRESKLFIVSFQGLVHPSCCQKTSNICSFPKIGVPLVIVHFRLGFSMKYTIYLWCTPIHGKPHICCRNRFWIWRKSNIGPGQVLSKACMVMKCHEHRTAELER